MRTVGIVDEQFYPGPTLEELEDEIAAVGWRHPLSNPATDLRKMITSMYKAYGKKHPIEVTETGGHNYTSDHTPKPKSEPEDYVIRVPAKDHGMHMHISLTDEGRAIIGLDPAVDTAPVTTEPLPQPKRNHGPRSGSTFDKRGRRKY